MNNFTKRFELTSSREEVDGFSGYQGDATISISENNWNLMLDNVSVPDPDSYPYWTEVDVTKYFVVSDVVMDSTSLGRGKNPPKMVFVIHKNSNTINAIPPSLILRDNLYLGNLDIRVPEDDDPSHYDYHFLEYGALDEVVRAFA